MMSGDKEEEQLQERSGQTGKMGKYREDAISCNPLWGGQWLQAAWAKCNILRALQEQKDIVP